MEFGSRVSAECTTGALELSTIHACLSLFVLNTLLHTKTLLVDNYIQKLGMLQGKEIQSSNQ